ncbi:MAG TPA: GNAT family N-acyltransferase [Bacteroidales bacterium]|nr:GNAT family N-acyltransferase [Bacteroidales bacterium]
MPESKHKVISKEDFQKVLKVKGFHGRLLSSWGMRIMKFDKLNDLYDKAYDKDSTVFVENCLRLMNINLTVSESDLNNIPESGPVVFLFNHPYGGLDALAIMLSVLKRRPDTKFLANFLLSRVEPVAHHLISVNPFESHKEAFSSLAGLKEMYKVIESGGAICILPAGEVSTKYGKSKVVEDRDWHINVMKFVKKVNAPVVSGFVSGQNSKLFHIVGKINPSLRTVRLPAELLNKKNRNIFIRFSAPLQPKIINNIEDKNTLAKVLKARTYCLNDQESTGAEVKPTVNYQDIVKALDTNLIKSEIEKIKKTDLLFTTDNYECYFSEHDNIPVIFDELTRLREIAFREIGEGTGKEKDFDKFDSYYNHLFLWDSAASMLVGSYRIGMGADIIKDKGIAGFYLNSLFEFKDDFKSYLGKSMEMGRSFIVPEYQRKPLPLFLLWKGIYHVTQKFPDYKYLIGPASISSLYSDNAKILIVEYLKRNHNWPELSTMVKFRKGFNYTSNHHHEILLSTFEHDLNTIDRLIKDIDFNHFGIPVLIKKYLSLGGKILCFNVDPDFNYTVDGLVVLDIDVVSQEVINSYNK